MEEKKVNVELNNNDFITEIIYNQDEKSLIIKYRLGTFSKYENLNNLNEIYDLAVYLLMKQYNMSYEDLLKEEIIQIQKKKTMFDVLKKDKIKNFKVRKTLIPLILAGTLTLTYLGISDLKTKKINNSNLRNDKTIETETEPSFDKLIQPATIMTSNIKTVTPKTLEPTSFPTPTPTLTPTQTPNLTNEPTKTPELTISPTISPTIKENTNANQDILLDIDYADNLVDYEFLGNTYQIIDTRYDYSKIPKKIGKQKKDACLTYSGRYASFIFSNSESITASTNGKTTNAITTPDENKILQILAKELLEGRPCIVQVNGNKKGERYSRHFVTVVGLRKNADLSKLEQTDFLIMDPGSATLKPLNVELEGKNKKRFLLSGEFDTRLIDYDYLALIYNNPDEYISEDAHHITKY